MSKIGFNEKLPKSCTYCVHSTILDFSNETICKKRGVMPARDYCHSYKYDPLKRIPQKIKISDNYSPDDFKL